MFAQMWKGDAKLVVSFPDTKPSVALMTILADMDTPDGEWLTAVIEELGPGHWKWEQQFGMWYWIQDAEAQDG